MRLIKTALFVFGLAGVFFITGNSLAHNTMHKHGQNMMGMQNQDSTAVMPGNQMMQTNQTLCPVTGNKIDKKTYVDYKGQRVYFCCQSCVAAFKKNPDKYIKSMNEKGIRLEKTPAKISTESKSEKSGS